MDFQAMFKKHSWKDPKEVNIEQYFTAEELADMCDYEMDRLRNIKKNYEMMIDLGIKLETFSNNMLVYLDLY